MTKLWNNVWVVGATVMGLAMSAPVLAVTNGVGPYYATPSWDQSLPAATRFIVLTNMNNEAVLDRETGLVWEQSPASDFVSWTSTSYRCVALRKGGRMGWRLPTIQELASVVDYSQLGPSLPPGHPFNNVISLSYWSATTTALDISTAFAIAFNFGLQETRYKADGARGWCVRGGSGLDPQ